MSPAPTEQQPGLPYPDTAALNGNMRHAYRVTRSKFITPRKGTALAYLGGDGILTSIGIAQDSDALIIGGLSSLAGNTVNLLMVGGKVPHLVAARSILLARDIKAWREAGTPVDDIHYPAIISADRFNRLLKEAEPSADDDKRFTLFKAAAEAFYITAGVAFMYGGMKGINLDALAALVNGDGAHMNTEKIISTIVNTSMIGYGALFSTGASIMIFGNDESRHHPTKTDVFSAWKIAKQRTGWRDRLRDFRYHTDLDHSGSLFMILGSSCLMVGAAALLAGGASAASAPLATAGLLLAVASTVYMVGDYCLRLDESSAIPLRIPEKKKRLYRLRIRALFSPRARRAMRVTRQSLKIRRDKKNADLQP